jgi:ABC-2 type transport system permease protein
MTILRLLRADWLKLKRTPVRWAVFAATISYPLLLLWYFSTYKVTPALPEMIYQAFFEVWGSFLPIILGVLTGLMGLQEEQAGSFSAVLGSPASRFRICASKWLLLILMLAGSLAVSTAILVLGMSYGLGLDGFDARVFMEGALLSMAGTLALSVLHLWLSFALGIGASVGIGGAGVLVAAIVGATVVGDPIWEVVPWAWPLRLAMHPLVPGIALFPGLLYAMLVFVVMAVLSLVWFHQWEGRRAEE